MTTTPALPPPYRVVAFEAIDSTNEEAKRLAAQGHPDSTVVWAERQLKGRGRRGRAWASPAGNLHCSFLLRPGCEIARAAQMSFAMALALVDAIAALGEGRLAARCKWPNDVLIGGRKVAGILLESAGATMGPLDWLVIGTGVNVAYHPKDTAFPATSLAAEGLAGVAPAEVLVALAAAWREWRERLEREGFAPVRAAWLGVAHGLGEDVAVRLDNATLNGRFLGLDADGALVLEDAHGGRRLVAAGEVYFPAP